MKRKLSLVLALCCALLLAASPVFAELDDNEVRSGHIKEADGTTGQDTNHGSGVKTGHIQDGAITEAKIADGAVTDTKISGVISGEKLGAHGHYGSDIVDGTVTSEKIADGAITDNKITGPISADKISGLPGKYANVVVVAKSGGDTDTLQGAIPLVSGASETNPYLIKVMPGVYEVTPGMAVYLRNYVDIEGSGEGVTIITGSAMSNIFVYQGLLTALNVNHAEIRNLTVKNTYYTGQSYSMYSTGITLINSALKLKNVTAVGLPTDGLSGNGCQGVAIRHSDSFLPAAEGAAVLTNVKALTPEGGTPFLISGSPADLNNVEADTPSGWAINGGGAAITMNNVKATSGDSAAVRNYSSGILTIFNSVFKGTTALEHGSSSPGYVVNSIFDAAVPFSGTNAKCVGVLDGNYDPVVCQ